MNTQQYPVQRSAPCSGGLLIRGTAPERMCSSSTCRLLLQEDDVAGDLAGLNSADAAGNDAAEPGVGGAAAAVHCLRHKQANAWRNMPALLPEALAT